MSNINSFYALSPYRVREVLFLASEYDFFVLEADGQLAERLFFKYSEFFMVGTPRITHVRDFEEAVGALKRRRFDLLVYATRDGELDSWNFLENVHSSYPYLPVLVVALDVARLRSINLHPLPKWLDGLFLWTGDLKLTTAMFNYVEDRFNVAEDTAKIGVQVIIAVEDTVSDYSICLTTLYDELIEQSRLLSGEGVNFTQCMLRMLARPKILLATNYEQAVELFDKYKRHVCALISDVRFSRGGRIDPQAGFRLAEYCAKAKPNLAILLQSSESNNSQIALDRGWKFVGKQPLSFRQALHGFLEENLGFGDFIFRLPDRHELARARNTFEFESIMKTVDPRSVRYHARNNNFNIWLRARNYFELADKIEEVRADDFADVEKLRLRLLEILHEYTLLEQNGQVADFSHKSVQYNHNLFKIGGGSIGGKARGLAFINSRLAIDNFLTNWPNIKIEIPRTVVLGTDAYDSFLSFNNFARREQKNLSDEELKEVYAQANIPYSLREELKNALKLLQGPLAVRSSSLLEDSQNQSCAGIYDTFMLRDFTDLNEKLAKVCEAIKKVYLSAVVSKARTYLENSRFLGEDEKMAVIIQELVGREHGQYFYPDFAGVAMSSNFYPVAPQKSEDGVIAAALGLGRTVARGENCLRFSPKWPKNLPHQSYQSKFLNYSQRHFYALDTSTEVEDNLVKLTLKQAEEDGVLSPFASVYSPSHDCWRDSLLYEGPRAITFSNLLHDDNLPIARAFSELLERFQKAMGCPVELEFAVNLHQERATLYLLQIRPLMGGNSSESVASCSFNSEEIFCTGDSLGHGSFNGLKEIVYVPGDNLGGQWSRKIVAQLTKFNRQLMAEGKPYILIGPGRWGSSDPNLGIPVQIGNISGAKVIIELPYGSRFVEPSMGSHFFHELASMRIGYMTICPGEYKGNTHLSARQNLCRENSDLTCNEFIHPDFIDREWLDSLPCTEEKDGVKHIVLNEPLRINLNGRCCRGTILHSNS